MNMKLLDKNTPLYARRLALEINRKGWMICGWVIWDCQRWTGARVRAGKLQVSKHDKGWTVVPDLNTAVFTTGSGREVCATRTIKR